jgi:ABC-type branched-subunit amino acid transport system substrate-binding protein
VAGVVLASALATLGGTLVGAAAGAQSTTTTAPRTTAPRPTSTTMPAGPLTATTVSVGGIVGNVPGDAGADVGAQARFARANEHGGVAGRRVVYVGTERPTDAATSAAAVGRLAPQVFAVVPASSPVLDANALTAAQLPFFGAADDASWTGGRLGYGFAGAQVPAPSRTVSPAWGITMRTLLGGAGGRNLAVLTTADALGARAGAAARASLRAAGFRVPVPLVVGSGTPTAAALAAAGPDGVVLLVDAPTVAATAAGLAATGYTGTVATGPAFYRPDAPAIGRGITVLLPYAPPEQMTPANRRLRADVERFASGTVVTPGVIAGYWAADEFLAVLAAAGRGAGEAKLLRAARTLEYEVAGTVGPTRFPGAHSQPAPCGALAQGDGGIYLVPVAYRCGRQVPLRPGRASPP